MLSKAQKKFIYTVSEKKFHNYCKLRKHNTELNQLNRVLVICSDSFVLMEITGGFANETRHELSFPYDTKFISVVSLQIS